MCLGPCFIFSILHCFLQDDHLLNVGRTILGSMERIVYTHQAVIAVSIICLCGHENDRE